ncbi:MAG: P-II family nitrogen regulator [Melioribacteraceae bacterium]
MKEIKAIIQPFMLTKVVTALHKIEGLPGVTISEIKSCGRCKTKEVKEKIADGIIEYTAKVKIEIVVEDKLAEKVVTIIQENAHTGNPGDGKIFIYSVEDIVRIRTNERGESAI